MSNALRGMIAGFVATLALGALLLLKGSLDLWPQLNIIRLLMGLGSISAAAAWMDHFIVGTVVWGLVFSLFDGVGAKLGHWQKGIIFGVFAWLMMMVLFLPAAGAGLFGNKIGIVAPVVMLGMHLIYGAVLGVTYGLLTAWLPAKDPEASPQA
jgi:hypothetical protein